VADARPLDTAFAALRAFDWSADAGFAKTLDAAVVAAHGNDAARADLERQFVEILAADTSRAAKDYACRSLVPLGTAAAVPALAALLPSPDHSHMARWALERIAAPAAGKALRDALATLRGDLAIGMMASLAARGDAASVPALVEHLQADGPEAVAAAVALGRIGTPAAAAALADADAFAGGARATAVADARLACAERLLAAGDAAAAAAAYKALAAGAAGKPAARRIELAATRGLLACADRTAS
jgi:hypothetical protein